MKKGLKVAYGLCIILICISSCKKDKKPSPVISFESTQQTINEGDEQMTVMIRSSLAATENIVVKVLLSQSPELVLGTNGDLEIYENIVANTLNLVIPAGSLTTQFSLRTFQDYKIEQTESIVFTIIDNENTYEIGELNSLNIYIEDQAFANPVNFTESTVSAIEGTINKRITLRSSQVIQDDIRVKIKMSNPEDTPEGIEGDFILSETMIDQTFELLLPAGSDSCGFSITTFNDYFLEGDENIIFQITEVSAGGQIGTLKMLSFIIEDDYIPNPVEFEYTSTSNKEGDNLAIRINSGRIISDDINLTVRISFPDNVIFGENGDFFISREVINNEFELTIHAGNTSTEFIITINSDFLNEGNEEIMFQIIDVSLGGNIGDINTMSFIITDDYTLNPVYFTQAYTSNIEGEQTTIRLNSTIERPIDLVLEIMMTMESSVIYGNTGDYILSEEVTENRFHLTIPSGEQSVSFSVNDLEDDILELPETIHFEIVSLSPGADMGTQITHSHTIRDQFDNEAIAYYPMDGNMQDYSLFPIDGTLTGTSATYNRHNEKGKALLFNGTSDYALIPHDEKFNFGNDDSFSISVWVYVGGLQADGSGPSNEIICKWNNNLNIPYPYVINYHNRFSNPINDNLYTFGCYRRDNDGLITQTKSNILSNDYLWHHLVMVKNNSDGLIYYYQDNVLINTVFDQSNANTKNTLDLLIGCRFPGGRHFKGKIDDLRFYNKALNVNEIDLLFKE